MAEPLTSVSFSSLASILSLAIQYPSCNVGTKTGPRIWDLVLPESYTRIPMLLESYIRNFSLIWTRTSYFLFFRLTYNAQSVLRYCWERPQDMMPPLWFPYTYVWLLFLIPKCMHNLSKLKDISHFLDPWIIRSRSFWRILRSGVVSAFPTTLVLSANFNKEDLSPVSKSLIYIIKRMSHNINPCGSPLVTGSHSEASPLSLFLTGDPIPHLLSQFSSRPADCNFLIRRSLEPCQRHFEILDR